MTKLSIEQIAKAAAGSGSAVQKASPFLNQMSGVIKDFKALLQMAQQVKGIAPAAPATVANQPYISKVALTPPQPQGGGFSKFLDLLIAQGYGDKPLGELIKEIEPYTLNQLLEVAKHAGLKK